MKNEARAPGTMYWNTGFSALLCTALGFLLLETCIVQLKGKPLVHVIGTLMAIGLGAGILLRIAPYRPTSFLPTGMLGQRTAPPSGIAMMSSGLLLAATGYAGAVVPGSGWATDSVIFAACVYLVPWSRIPLCRRGFAVPLCIVMLAALAVLVARGPLPHPVSLLISAWLLWVTAIFTWAMLFIVRQRQPRTR